MLLSKDGSNWDAEEDYAVSKVYSFDGGDGTKTIYLKLKDQAGNWSVSYSDSIVLDTTKPTGTVSINSGAVGTNSANVVLTLSAVDANNVTEMQFSNDSLAWSAIEPYATTKNHTLNTTDGVKTVYLRYKDTAGNWTTAVISDTIILDATAPTGTLTVNGGWSFTNSTNVTLALTGTDSGIGMGAGAQMKFSNDNNVWTAAENYAPSKVYTLPSRDGSKTVYVKYSDALANWSSSTISGTIILDTVLPTGSISINSGAVTATGVTVTLALSGNDESGSGLAQMQFSNDGTNYSAAEAYAATKIWNLTSGTGQKTVYVKYLDNAGNWSLPYNDTIEGISSSLETVWVEDAIPAGASEDGEPWIWLTNNPAPFSGTKSHKSNYNAGSHLHYFYGGTTSFTVVAGDILFTYIYLEAGTLPDTIVLQFSDGGNWEHRAYWGANLFTTGVNGTDSLRYVGPIPAAGSWVRLEVPASQIGVEGKVLNGMAYTLVGGAASWDRSGKVAGSGDSTPPTGTISINSGAVNTSTGTVTLALSASDVSGVSQMQFSNDGTNYTSAEAYTGTRVFTLAAGDGTKTVYVKYKDTASNWSGSFSDTIILDTTAPTGSVNINGGALTCASSAVTLSLTYSDTTSSVVSMKFSNDASSWSSPVAVSSSANWTLSAGDGSKTVYVEFLDSVGNWSGNFSDAITLTTTVPSGTVTVNSGASFTTATTVTLALTSGSAVSMQFSNDGGSYSTPEAFSTSKVWALTSTEGIKTVYVKFGNVAGVFSSSYTDTINLDTMAPTGTISLNGGVSYATGVNVTISNSIVDAGTSVISMRFSNDGSTWSSWENYAVTKSFTLSAGDGVKTVYGNFKDQSGFTTGNIADAITLDATGPTGTVSINSGATTATSTSITLSLTAVDAGSSTVSMRFNNDGGAWGAWLPYAVTASWTLGSANGTRTVYAAFNDANGNVSSASISDTIILDNAGPTGTLIINGGAASTSTTGVTLSLTYSDLTGTVVSMRFSDDGSSWSTVEAVNNIKLWNLPGGSGTKTVYVQYRDAAGNWSANITDTINLTGVALPTGTVLINSGALRTNTHKVTLALSAASAGATVVSMRFTNDSGSFGAAESYSTSKVWNLSAVNGTRTVNVQYGNNLGVWSGSISDTINLCLVEYFKVTMPPKVLAGTTVTVTASAMQDVSTVATQFTAIGCFETTDTSVVSIPEKVFTAGTATVLLTVNSSGMQVFGVYDKEFSTYEGNCSFSVFKSGSVGTSGATITDASGAGVEIPAGALNGTINIGMGAEPLPLDPVFGKKYGYTKNPLYRDFGEINLTTLSLTGVTFNKKVKITIPYSKEDLEAGVTESALRIFRYNPVKREYELVDGTQFVSSGKISCYVDHFSMYRILESYIKTNLDSVTGYPSPYRPGAGVDGKFKIINMPGDCTVDIYTISGDKVITLNEREMSVPNAGWVEWDGKNASREPVAMGVYVYHIKTADGQKRTGKVGLIK